MKITNLQKGSQITFNNMAYNVHRIIETQIILEHSQNLSITSFSYEEFYNYYLEGKISFIIPKKSQGCNNSDNIQLDLQALSQADQDIVYYKLHYIKSAINSLGNIPTQISLQQVIDNVSHNILDLNPPASLTVYKWWKKWEQSNHDINVLFPQKTGPKQLHRNHNVIEKIFLEIIEEVYFSVERPSIKKTYDAFLFQMHIKNNQSPFPYDIPSKSKFYRMMKSLNPYEVMLRRYGKRKAEQHYRVAGKGVITSSILERVEVDHTPADVMVIDATTGNTIGRPYFTALIDVYSRMPLSIEIGFEPPSALSVLRALKQAILPKNNSIYDNTTPWISYGIPSTLICDNGSEFHSNTLRRVAAELNIELIFCPSASPNYKGCVERFLGSLNEQLCHSMPGTTFSNINTRDNYPSESLATLTLENLKELVYIFTTDIYMQSIHSSLQQTPISKWKESITSALPLLPENIDTLDLIFSQSYFRHLSHKGIIFEHLHYNSEDLKTLRIKYGNTHKVEIRVNPEDLGSIWVFDGHNSYIDIPCTEQQYAQGLTLFQHKIIRGEQKEHGLATFDEFNLLKNKEKVRIKIQDTIRTSSKIRKKVKAKRVNLSEKTLQLPNINAPKITHSILNTNDIKIYAMEGE